MDGRRTDSGDGHGGRQKNIPVSRACVELCIGVKGGKSGGGESDQINGIQLYSAPIIYEIGVIGDYSIPCAGWNG